MSLPALQWRKLPVVTISSAISSSDYLRTINNMLTGSTYFDGSARTVGSGSAWSSSIAYTTGSNVEAVLCYPPLTTQLSQSVLIITKATSGAASGGTPTLATSEAAFLLGSIYVGLSKNSGNFTNWTGSTPMGISSSFSGYMNMLAVATHTFTTGKITIYESKEALILNIGNSSTPTVNYVVLCGALYDPQQTTTSVEAELDNRLYGILKSHRTTGPETTFLTSNGNFLDHYVSTTSAKHVMFTPQQSVLKTMYCTKFTSTNFVSSGFISNTGKLVKIPLYFVDLTTGNFQGTLRDVYAIRASANNLIFRDGSSNIVGFTISNTETSANDAILLSYT